MTSIISPSRRGSILVDYEKVEIANLRDPKVVRELFRDAQRVARKERFGSPTFRTVQLWFRRALSR